MASGGQNSLEEEPPQRTMRWLTTRRKGRFLHRPQLPGAPSSAVGSSHLGGSLSLSLFLAVCLCLAPLQSMYVQSFPIPSWFTRGKATCSVSCVQASLSRQHATAWWESWLTASHQHPRGGSDRCTVSPKTCVGGRRGNCLFLTYHLHTLSKLRSSLAGRD